MSYLVYLLVSSVNPHRTYIGSTNNISRRVRQHNGEITGGAAYTHTGRPWTLACTIRGFQDFRQALQFEWGWKYTGRCDRRRDSRGLSRRKEHLALLMSRKRWTSHAPLASTVQLEVTWDVEPPGL
jgi:structure-specific endonuclease subunit SLX1